MRLWIIASPIIDDAKVAKRVRDKNQRDVDVDVTSIFLGVFFWFPNKGDEDLHERGIPFPNTTQHAVRLTDRQRPCAPVLRSNRVKLS